MTRSKPKRKGTPPLKPKAASKSEAALSSPDFSHVSTGEGFTITSAHPQFETFQPTAVDTPPIGVQLDGNRAPSLIPQPKGGALLSGGKPGNKGGTGRPTNEIRDMLRGYVGDHAGLIADIASGAPVQRTRVRIADLVEHVYCPKCRTSARLIDVDDLFEEISVVISASPRDRIAALEFASRYGLGTIKEVSIHSVRERVGKTLELIRERVGPEQYASIVQAIEPVWS